MNTTKANMQLNRVDEFCSQLARQYGAGFNQVPIIRGVKVMGEFYTQSNRLVSLMLSVYIDKVDIEVYDSFRRMIYSKTTRGNIATQQEIHRFLYRVYMTM